MRDFLEGATHRNLLFSGGYCRGTSPGLLWRFGGVIPHDKTGGLRGGFPSAEECSITSSSGKERSAFYGEISGEKS